MGKSDKPKSQKAKYYGKKGSRSSKENEQPIKGPGIFMTSPRGKEHRAVAEAYDLFNQIADRLYPSIPPEGSSSIPAASEDTQDIGDSIEDALKAELQDLKKPRAEGGMRFQSRKTHTDCLAFISVAKPYDPVLLVQEAVKDLLSSKTPTSKFILRLTPVTSTCNSSSLSDVEELGRKVLEPVFRPLSTVDSDEPVTFKLQLSIRSHNTLSRMLLLPAFVGLVQHYITEPAAPSASASDAPPAPAPAKRRTVKTDLENPQYVVIVEILKNICGVSVVDGALYEHEGKRFNLEAIATTFFPDAKPAAIDGEASTQVQEQTTVNQTDTVDMPAEASAGVASTQDSQ